MTTNLLRIGELAQATGVDNETIRYYEKTGLLPAPIRSGNGYHAYGVSHLERLAFIRHCRALNISLADVIVCWNLSISPRRIAAILIA